MIRIRLAYSQTLKMVEVHYAETTAIFYQTTLYHIPGNSTLHDHYCENIKSNSKLYSQKSQGQINPLAPYAAGDTPGVSVTCCCTT
jgi:hypothetical protein